MMTTRTSSIAIVLMVALAAAAAAGSAQASSVPLGTRIVCLVYSDLNDFGPPIPLMTAQDCNATSTPPGGGELTVVKEVSGGSASPSDFQIHVSISGADISGSPQPGSSSGTTYVGIASGNYVVSETGSLTSSYAASFSDDCRRGGIVAVTSNYPATCVVTNTFGGATSSGAQFGSIAGTFTASVISTTSATSSGSSSLSGTVGGGNSLTGTVVSPPGGGGGGGGGSNGPPVGLLGGGGGGGSPGIAIVPLPGGVIGGGVPSPSSASSPSSRALPGIPNTGEGGAAPENALILIASAGVVISGLYALRRANSSA